MEGVIHIAGVMPRIGTTTLALQLVQYLKRTGYEAAYVEANTQDYIWGVTSLYQDCLTDKSSGKTTYSGIDFYPADKLSVLTAGGAGYDYLICDYGNVMVQGFQKEDFQTCGAMILVGGVKPNEIFFMDDALRNECFQDAIYAFNFIREQDQKDILDMMGARASKTVFVPPSLPDPFIPVDENDDLFYEIMTLVVRQIVKGGPKREI